LYDDASLALSFISWVGIGPLLQRREKREERENQFKLDHHLQIIFPLPCFQIGEVCGDSATEDANCFARHKGGLGVPQGTSVLAKRQSYPNKEAKMDLNSQYSILLEAILTLSNVSE
jgi:hypothetical protein